MEGWMDRGQLGWTLPFKFFNPRKLNCLLYPFTSTPVIIDEPLNNVIEIVVNCINKDHEYIKSAIKKFKKIFLQLSESEIKFYNVTLIFACVLETSNELISLVKLLKWYMS